MADTFTLSVEPQGGKAYQHPFHLGTDEKVARQIAEETFRGVGAASVALKRGGDVRAIYDGEWSNRP